MNWYQEHESSACSEMMNGVMERVLNEVVSALAVFSIVGYYLDWRLFADR